MQFTAHQVKVQGAKIPRLYSVAAGGTFIGKITVSSKPTFEFYDNVRFTITPQFVNFLKVSFEKIEAVMSNLKDQDENQPEIKIL